MHPSTTRTVNCFQGHLDCKDLGNSQSQCADALDELCNFRMWVGLLVAGIVLFVVGDCAFFYFACCSKPPHHSDRTAEAQMHGVAVPAQPGYAVPGYAPGAPHGAYQA
jgi:hypothetical protein